VSVKKTKKKEKTMARPDRKPRWGQVGLLKEGKKKHVCFFGFREEKKMAKGEMRGENET